MENNNVEEKRSFIKKSEVIIILIAITLLASIFVIRYFYVEYNAKPNIELKGEKVIYLESNEKFKDPGVYASLNAKDITKKVKVKGKVDSSKIENYVITYTVTNNKGKNKKTVKRKVVILDKIKPVIKLKGQTKIKLSINTKYNEAGYTAEDNVDGNLTDKVKVFNKVKENIVGSYEVLYEVKDSSNNTGYAKRRVIVGDYTSPVIKLTGNSVINIKSKTKYQEPGYTAEDNIDGDITEKVRISGSVKTSPGVYTLTYRVSDDSGNSTYKTRTVYVGTKAERAKNNQIKISISSQHLWYYKNGSVFVSTSVVTGHLNKHDTPRGQYSIKGKYTNVTLRGPGYASPVTFWMPISSSGVGLHDASWRGSFGGSIYKNNGSHGCINMPYWAAQKVFNNAPVGTIVTIY